MWKRRECINQGTNVCVEFQEEKPTEQARARARRIVGPEGPRLSLKSTLFPAGQPERACSC